MASTRSASSRNSRISRKILLPPAVLTLDIVAESPYKFRAVATAAGANVTLHADQIKRFKPELVSVKDESLIAELREALAGTDHMPEIIPGDEGIIEVARHPDAVTVVTGIVGCAGLKVLLSICSLLTDPNPDDPLVP